MADEQKPITYIFLNDRDLEDDYQPINADNLETENKQIVDAINELKIKIQELEEMLQRLLNQ